MRFATFEQYDGGRASVWPTEVEAVWDADVPAAERKRTALRTRSGMTCYVTEELAIVTGKIEAARE